MNQNLFRGELVRLAAPDPEEAAQALFRWAHDSEYMRLLNDGPARMGSLGKFKEWMQKDYVETERADVFLFMIRTLEGDRLVGDIELEGIRWNHGDGWLAIGIGDRQDWSRGYGTDALRVLLRYAFDELNLHRVSLSVFEYNPRAMRAYEKAGFVVEGRTRQFLRREGRCYDLIYMGILREEWENQVKPGA